MLKIIALTYRDPWPPITGDRVRAWQHISLLAEDHEITLLTFDSKLVKSHPNPLEEKCKAVHWIPLDKRMAWIRSGMAMTSLNKYPLQVAYYNSPCFSECLDSLLRHEKFDLMYLSLVRTAPYGFNVKRLPRLLDYCDALSLQFLRRGQAALGWRSMLFAMESRRLLHYERKVAATFEKTIITAPVDACYIGTDRPPEVIPNTIGLEPEVNEFGTSDFPRGRFNVAFLGDMGNDYSENALDYFMQKIWPKVLDACPDAIFWIIGRNPTRRIRNLAARNIKVTGTVSNFQRYFERLQVVVAPLKSGTGVKNRVIQPMAAGVPVVITSIANEGLGAEAGQQVLLSDDADKFAQCVITLLLDQEYRCKIGEAGQEFVLQRFGPQHIRALLAAAVNEAVLSRP